MIRIAAILVVFPLLMEVALWAIHLISRYGAL